MDEIWERAVETALDGHTDHTAARTLTLDGAVKCFQGRLPPPGVLEKFENLQHLSVANIGVSSLEQFPRLRNLQKLILSDNRISGGLEFLVEAGLHSLRDLDLSNNRIQYIEDLAPLAQLKLVSLDLYECPVTRVKDYRSRVLGLIKSLKYLDKMDAEGNERPESDEEEDEEDEDEDEDDPGSGEIDGEDRLCRMNNGHSKEEEGVADVDEDEDEDEDEESDADEEETETGRRINGQSHEANGFHIGQVGRDDDEDDDEDVSDEEVDDDEEEEEEDIVEDHEIGGSDDEEDGVEDDEEEEVDNYETDLAEPGSTGVLTSTEGEIDAHEHGEDDGDDDDDGETGEEEEHGVENDVEFEDEEEGEEEDDDYGEGYLVQPVGQAEEHDAAGGDMEPVNEEDDVEEEEEVEDDEEELPSSSQLKRKRSGDAEEDVDDDDEEEEDVEFTKSSKKHR